MRDELRRAKESERAAQRSKRELVASLSHDIQTPVASIKAVAELMEVTADDNERARLQTIQQKAGQIQMLVTDLFHATLEELRSLNVTPTPLPSDQISEMIKKSDYFDMVKIGEIPGCLLYADPVRLSQVVDNIIANSYKYADTEIDVSAKAD
jgi:signal transduction histidine kinase